MFLSSEGLPRTIAGFLSLTTIDIWGMDHPLLQGVSYELLDFGSIRGLYLLDANTTSHYSSSQNIPKHCQVPWAAKSPSVETTRLEVLLPRWRTKGVLAEGFVGY